MSKHGGGWSKREMVRFAKEQLARPEVQAMDPELRLEYVYALGCIYGSPQANFYHGTPALHKRPKEAK